MYTNLTMIKSLFHKYTEWRDRCRQCDTDGISIAQLNYFDNLHLISTAKGCKEYCCNKCDTKWSFAEGSKWMNKVVRSELYEAWKRTNVIPTELQIEALKKIKGVCDKDKVNTYYPCRVVSGNIVFEKAIIIETSGNFFGKFPCGREVHLLNESHSISPSIYALPHEIRMASMTANEVSMGFAPVNIRNNNGNIYTLHSQMHFVDVNGLRGSDFKLDDEKPHRKNILHPDWADGYFICDNFCNIKTAQQGDALKNINFFS